MPEDIGDLIAEENIADDPNPEEVQPGDSSFVKPWRPPQDDQDDEENA